MSFFALASLAGPVLSSLMGASAASKAAKAQEAASREALALQREIYGQQRADQMPFRVTGSNALLQLADLFGVPRPVGFVNPDGSSTASQAQPPRPQSGYDGNQLAAAIAQQPRGHEGDSVPFADRYARAVEQLRQNQPSAAPAAAAPANALTAPGGGFQTSPGYQFRVQEGVNALDKSAAAKGLLFSGAQSKALTNFGQNIASEEFNNFANRLASLAGIGQTSVNQSGVIGANFANASSNLMENAGLARASGYVGSANALTGGMQNFLTALPAGGGSPAPWSFGPTVT